MNKKLISLRINTKAYDKVKEIAEQNNVTVIKTIEDLILNSTLHNSINRLIEALKEDNSSGSYYHTWQSNIACTIMDNSELDHYTSNVIARRFLDRLINK